MELHYEVSLSAYILLHEAIKELDIKEPLENSRQNGNIKRILKRCNHIIESRYSSVKQTVLKSYITNILENETGLIS